MNNNINSFQEDDWIDDLSEIQNELSKTEVEEIEFLCKDYLQGELIPGYFKFCTLLFCNNNKKIQGAFSKFLRCCAKFVYQL